MCLEGQRIQSVGAIANQLNLSMQNILSAREGAVGWQDELEPRSGRRRHEHWRRDGRPSHARGTAAGNGVREVDAPACSQQAMRDMGDEGERCKQ
jgi:hypothetical protein